MTEEYKKCLEDPVYFMEHYCLVNGKPIKLTNCQKKHIEYLYAIRSKKN